MLKKLGCAMLQGAAFGLGLLLLAGVLLYSFGSFTVPIPGRTEVENRTMQPQRPTAEQLVITNAKEVAGSTGETSDSKCGQISVVYPKQFTGTIENLGPDSGHYLNVYADLFDKDGEFIFQCQTQFQEPLRHGEKQNFLIGCHSLPAAIANTYASFRIYARG